MARHSTVDWCEENYAYSSFIAEFWNTLSSLALVYAGYRGWKIHSNLKGSGIYVILILVGVGSVFFHAILDVHSQMLDEIPMIFFVCQLFINVLQLENCIGKIFAYLMASISSYVVYSMALLEGDPHDRKYVQHYSGVIDAINRIEFYVFQSGIILSAIAIFIRLVYKVSRKPAARTLLYRGCSTFLLGWCCWLVDYFLCSQLQSTINPQFHAWWHVLSAIGTYQLALLSLVFANRDKELHYIEWEGFLRILPTVTFC